MKSNKTYSTNINKPLAEVWKVLGDVTMIENYSPTIKTSVPLNDKTAEVGAGRTCSATPMGKLTEEVVSWGDHTYTLNITMKPGGIFRKNLATFAAKDNGDHTTSVTIRHDADMRFPMPGMEKSMSAILAGLDHFIETGERVDSMKGLDLSKVTVK